MAEKVKETAREEVERIRGLAEDAARSGAYLYPVKGIIYFLSHQSLWKPLLSKLAPTVTLGLGVTTFMFLFTYLPQVALLTFTQGPLAAVSTVLLVLSESSTLFNVLSKNFLIADALLDTFDGTLVSRNMTAIVAEGRQVKAGGDPIAKLGKLIKSPFAKFAPSAIIRYFLYLPLNFIPFVGTLMFVLLQGRRYGAGVHERYFQLKGWSSKQREAWIKERTPAYTSFGVVAFLLELIPVGGILFSFTNTVGAALWAAQMEQGATTSPELREQAESAKR